MGVLDKVFLYKVFRFDHANIVFFNLNLRAYVSFRVDHCAKVWQRARIYQLLLALLKGVRYSYPLSLRVGLWRLRGVAILRAMATHLVQA